MTIIMESTYILLPDETKKELSERGVIKELENKVKYLIIEE